MTISNKETTGLDVPNEPMNQDIAGYKYAEDLLRNIALGISSKNKKAFSIVKYLSKALGMEYAFIGRLTGKDNDIIQTIAVCQNGKIIDNIKYKYAHTPCKNAINKRFYYLPDGLQKLFPNNHPLTKIGMASYIGAPLFSSGGYLIGLIAALGREPLRHPEIARSALQIFASQIAFELERKLSKDALIRSQADLQKKHEALSQQFNQVETAKREWERTVDCIGDMVILADGEGKIRRCNHAVKTFTKMDYEELSGKDLKSLLNSYKIKVDSLYTNGLELFHAPTGKYFVFNSYPFKEPATDINGSTIAGTVITIYDATELKKVSKELETKNKAIESNRGKLEEAYNKLKATQAKILHQEKMASIGQLAAGVAHEINNPLAYICSNLSTLQRYVRKLVDLFQGYEALDSYLLEDPRPEVREVAKATMEEKTRINFLFIRKDLIDVVDESLEGAEKLKEIVLNLKSFSRVDEAEHTYADINECLESTLKIVWNEIKYKATVKKEYGDLPHTKCYPQQLNQVFTNLLVNAAHAIEERGEIGIKTWQENGSIIVSISDSGCGISEDNIKRVFEPFFTTKEVGKGTGLGLSISYDIIKNHDGEISVESNQGKGAIFTIKIPILEK